MRAAKYLCSGCSANKVNKVVFHYCHDCHYNAYRINRLAYLILCRYPKLRGELISDIIIRLWIKHVEGTEHEAPARKLLTSKPEQLPLW